MGPGCTHPSSAPRVCVIGAGVSGLTAVKALGDRNVPHICFEASDGVGGNWYFRNPNGRSSAYRSLHIDTSKAAIGFNREAREGEDRTLVVTIEAHMPPGRAGMPYRVRTFDGSGFLTLAWFAGHGAHLARQ